MLDEKDPVVIGNAISQQAGMALTNAQGVRRNELIASGMTLDAALRQIAEEFVRSPMGEQWVRDHLDTLSVDRLKGLDA